MPQIFSAMRLLCVVALLLAAQCAASAHGHGVQTGTHTPTPVNIFWTRHGLSCANVLTLRHATRVADPFLTNCGIHRSTVYGEQVRLAMTRSGIVIQWVGSSTLRRAMQTASFMFPEATVEPMPFVSEEGFTKLAGLGIGVDNFPLAVDRQRATLKAAGMLAAGGVNFDDLESFGGGRLAPDYEKALAYLANQVLPRLQPSEHGSIDIVIVAHGHFIKTLPGFRGNDVRNNQVFAKAYTFMQAQEENRLVDLRDFNNDWAAPVVVVASGGPFLGPVCPKTPVPPPRDEMPLCRVDLQTCADSMDGISLHFKDSSYYATADRGQEKLLGYEKGAVQLEGQCCIDSKLDAVCGW